MATIAGHLETHITARMKTENILLRACQQTIPGKVLNKQANDASFNRDIGVYCGGRPLLTFQA